MFEGSSYPEDIMNRENGYDSLLYTDEIFKAFVDAIIPRTPALAEEYGRIQYYGALDLYTDEYLIYMLNYGTVPMAEAAARMLEIATEYFFSAEMQDVVNTSEVMELSDFGALSRLDRLRVVSFLENSGSVIPELPSPFTGDQYAIASVTNSLNGLAMLGYYSEWSGYGSTRLLSPNQWVMEYFPVSWEQVGYPGPSLGYRALRSNNSQ